MSINNAINFLKKFCLERLNQEFNKNYKDFNPHQFLQNYHDFLMYAGYYHFGIVRIGAYLIWSALIKYLEDLQGEDEFQVKKGAFLGNWYYKQANKNGFTPEKLILINSNKKPTQRYKDMRKQVESFPKTPIIIDVDFPKDDKSYFHEIDFLGLKASKMVFVLLINS